jgi:hypothetical protein
MQATEPVDADFVKALSSGIHGIFSTQIQRFDSPKVEAEFRKAVHDPKLSADERFMDNLMFVVRKKNIVALRADVETALNSLPLKPDPEVSAMKTLYALGGDRERSIVDERFARKLFAELKSSEIPAGPYLPNAERVGGARTLAVLQNSLTDAQNRQKQAEQNTPSDHVRIGQLDKVRSSIELQALMLSRKAKLLAQPSPQREHDMVRLAMERTGHLSFWAYREAIRLATPATPGAVREFLTQEIQAVVPKAGLSPEQRDQQLQQTRLRAVLLLEDIHAALQPEEKKLLEENAALIKENPGMYKPDWEKVLDLD